MTCTHTHVDPRDPPQRHKNAEEQFFLFLFLHVSKNRLSLFYFQGHNSEYVETISSQSLDTFHGNTFRGSVCSNTRHETSFQVLKATEEDASRGNFHYR